MIETCACANPTTWSKALYHLLGEEVVCIECNSAHGPRHASAARDRLAAGGRLYLTEEELNPGPRAGATTSADMTEEQKKRQRQLAGLPGSGAGIRRGAYPGAAQAADLGRHRELARAGRRRSC